MHFFLPYFFIYFSMTTRFPYDAPTAGAVAGSQLRVVFHSKKSNVWRSLKTSSPRGAIS